MRVSFRPELFVTPALTAVLTLAACTPASEQPSPRADPTETMTATTPRGTPSTDKRAVVARPVIVMLGDSLTAGYQLDPHDALPEQIQTRLDAEPTPATILNAGVSGDTTRGGLERYDWSVKGANADILLIALGANDFLSGIGGDAPMANLAAIIERAQADGVMVGLIGVSIPEHEGLDGRDLEFDAIYPDLAARYDIPLHANMMASVFGRTKLLQSDGIHPTAEGVQLMAEDLSGFVSELAADWSARNGAAAGD